ncbi:hypothetical protein [Roseovarius sp. D22-M7]|uniref:hypothetical protein n=1 Tax=Roseovarius sp. D22-M7 TaxID=3127116 RepID=UPI00300F9DD1
MMVRLLCLGVFCLAGAASAQTVSVRSGEHGSFTRLALDMPYKAEWQMAAEGEVRKIRFSEPGLDFDTTRVFDRIGKGRLRAIDPAPGELELDLACDCGVQAFWHTDTMLVLDIGEAFPRVATPPQPSIPSASAPEKDIPHRTTPSNDVNARLSRRFATRLPDMRFPDPTGAGGPSSEDERADLSQMRKKLLTELGRAASQGLLTPSPRTRPESERLTDTGTAQPASAAPRGEDSAATAVAQPSGGAALNLRAQSSIDDAISSIQLATTPADGNADCPTAELVDLPSWAGTEPFHQQIGALNRQLLREFDRPDEEIALQLARAYLHFGFGAEARQILDLRSRGSEADRILHEISLIMDHGHVSSVGRLADMTGCGEPAVLWALLAMPAVPVEAVFDHKALLRSFAALPAPLRNSFGPELARRLSKARHAKTARDILRMTARTGAPDSPDLALARVELGGAESDAGTTRADLDTAVASNSVAAAEALARMIDGLLSEGAPVPLDKAELAGAYAFEHRGTDLGRRMTGAYLSALGASGAFAEAVAEYERLRSELDAAGATEIAASLLGQMTRHADDVTFLRHALNDRLVAPAMVPADPGVDIATRLLGSGLAERARQFVAADLPGRNARPSKLARAQIALVQDRPRQAEVELLGLDGPDADLLRARARSVAGDHAAARALYVASDRPEEAAEAAWLAQDLDRMATAQDPVLRQTVAALRDSSADVGTDSTPILERNRALLESSGTLRAAMTTLLDAKGMPGDPQE